MIKFILSLFRLFSFAFIYRQRLEAIAEYEGEDPLSVHYDYICWIEQNYPKGGSESGLDKAVLECICAFDSEEFPQFMKYRQDRRMIKLYIKYVSLFNVELIIDKSFITFFVD